MKKVIFFLAVLFLLASCGNSGNGELTGVQNRPKFYQPTPYGMEFIPIGSFVLGASDEDVPYAQVHQPKTVTVQAFYMDQTEVTNNEYRQFVHWVRDSIAHVMLGTNGIKDHLITETRKGEPIEPPVINWKTKIRWNGAEEEQALVELYYPENERILGKKEIDPRKLNYVYYWIDKRAGAGRGNVDRASLVKKEIVNVYPDTLTWLRDFVYSFNEPMSDKYFWHPAYDNYPVVGVTWKQAKAFCAWRTQVMNKYLAEKENAIINEFRLPTESEWEWAARGGLALNVYPWGGPYLRNHQGCFLANFKPMRGNYVDDGGVQTVVVAHYPPNDFGLYDMAGNVAEWTNDAFDEASYNFTHDLNPQYTYEAKDSDPPTMKRKVVRGGSWKDVGYYLQVSTRTYEYQDTAKCYIGFRCAQTFLGRQQGDNPNNASHIYH